MTKKAQHALIIPPLATPTRLDQALAQLLPEYSRTILQTWIKNKEVTLNGQPVRTRTEVTGGERIAINGTIKQQPAYAAQAITLDIIHEDDVILVINKPIGMVVHPAAGNPDKTLLNALLHHAPTLQDLPRAGIVHRLDKDTSGLLVIAKTPLAIKKLTAQIKNRSMIREYQAIIAGVLISGGTVDEPITRNPLNRKQMKVMDSGKPAVSHYRVIERYRAYTRIKVQLETGRTHQIRVHMAYIQHPLLGDQVYAGRLHIPKGSSQALIDALRTFKHQALCAFRLGFIHPTTQKPIEWEIDLPQDMQQLIKILKEDNAL